MSSTAIRPRFSKVMFTCLVWPTTERSLTSSTAGLMVTTGAGTLASKVVSTVIRSEKAAVLEGHVHLLGLADDGKVADIEHGRADGDDRRGDVGLEGGLDRDLVTVLDLDAFNRPSVFDGLIRSEERRVGKERRS